MHTLASAKKRTFNTQETKKPEREMAFKIFFDLVSCSDICWSTEQATRLQNFCLPLTLPSIPQ